MRRSESLLTRIHSIGILVWLVLIIPHSESLRGSAVVLQARSKLAEAKVEQVGDDVNGTVISLNTSTKPHLTGIPQIDYVHDPNLPRELNGYNLTDYPFFNAIPEEIDFKCDGLHDGFYASVPHKCQVYHHCLFGFRYDFLCANYTAFDQKTFICHFVSEVDCVNSPKYFKRNEDLYKEASTSTTTTTTTAAPSTTRAAPQPPGNGGLNKHNNGRRRRPYRRRRPMYEYYYDDEEYPESDYYEDEVPVPNLRKVLRKQNKDSQDHHNTRDTQDSETAEYDNPPDMIKPSVRTSGSVPSSVYDKPRTPPKIRRPVPKSERDKYDYIPKASSHSSTISPTEKPTTTPSSKKVTITTTTPPPSDDEYYEDDEYEYEEQPRNVKSKHQHADYDFPTGAEDTRPYSGRPHRARPPARKRTDIYDDYDVKERPRMNRRKEYTRHDDRPRGRPMYRNKNRQDDHVAGGYMKKRISEPEYRRRTEKRPTYEDDYYYDEEEEYQPKRTRRPFKTTEKPKTTTKHYKTTERTSTESKPTETTTRPSKPTVSYSTNSQRNAKASSTLENETTRENEIPTTENVSARTTHKYKTIKVSAPVPVIDNGVREDVEDSSDFASTEETRISSPQSRPTTTVILKMAAKPEPRKPLDEMPNKTITTIRHFVIAPPVRKPSHFGFMSPVAPFVNTTTNFREDVTKLPEQKNHQQEFYRSAQYIKIPVSMTPMAAPVNRSYHPSTAFSTFFVPIEAHANKAKPVEEHLAENLNAIHYNSAYVTESKPFESTKSQPYRQYTNALSFPQRPPPSYDITAPGPSAAAEETNSSEKKYSELPAYTANADYDVTYNDALQPSTLHPVRRFPSTSFYIQNQPRRQTSEYAFNDSAFTTLNRSQKRYT